LRVSDSPDAAILLLQASAGCAKDFKIFPCGIGFPVLSLCRCGIDRLYRTETNADSQSLKLSKDKSNFEPYRVYLGMATEARINIGGRRIFK
jgi:hypothetical protein